jgi:hypothetical protein
MEESVGLSEKTGIKLKEQTSVFGRIESIGSVADTFAVTEFARQSGLILEEI